MDLMAAPASAASAGVGLGDAIAEQWLAKAKRGLLNIKIGNGDDPRVGSNRDDSKGGGTLSSTNGSKGSSLSQLGSTFIPVVVYTTVCLIIFFILRRRLHRVYAPRTIPALRTPETPIPSLPNGWFNWIKPFFKTPDAVLLNHGSLDGFFFLRFIKILRNICLVGCLIAWPVLFPLHITGGRGLKELELLTIGNIDNPLKLYAHALVAWILFGFVLFTVSRESVYYVNLRQAFLSSPYYSQRLSSRTVLFTSVPRRYLDPARIRKLYGDGVRRVWIPKTSKALANLVKEREQTAMRLERAEMELIRTANAARNKQRQKEAKRMAKHHKKSVSIEDAEKEPFRPGSRSVTHSRLLISQIPTPQARPETPPDLPMQLTIRVEDKPEDTTPIENTESVYIHPYGLDAKLPDVRGSVAAQFIGAEKRPHHRPLGNFGRRVDTIRWTRVRLLELNERIVKLRKRLRRGGGEDSDTRPVVFVEFDTQEAAQAAHQVVAHHQPLHMAPRLLGIRSDDIVWSSLRMNWLERIVRRFLILALIMAAVVFWSIPSAFVGLISNIQSLTELLPFLSWLNHLPGPIKGFLTGFVPAMALTFFMTLVPSMLRFCAVVAGVPSYSMVELFTQTAYFAFQVVQVFLVTTLTSAASNAFFDILLDPIKAKDLLAQNLPRASNFYLSYILIQCLASAGTSLIHPFDLIRHVILSRIAQLPRMHHRLWFTMRPTRWGRDFPVFANLGVIALCYACIAPLILIFAAGGMAITHLVWRYNLLYVLDSNKDSHGLFYPRALMHLTVGLYLAEVCLIGLFFLNGGIGPGVMIVLLLIFTALVHYSLSNAISPLVQNLPQTLTLEEEIQEEERAAAEAARRRAETADDPTGAAATYYDVDEEFGDADDDLGPLSDDYSDEEEGPLEHGFQESRAVEGASDFRSAIGAFLSSWTKKAAKDQLNSLGVVPPTKEETNPSTLIKWFSPHIHDDFIAIRKNLMDLPASLETTGDRRYTYMPPEMWAPKPVLWIPRDDARVSRQEVAHTRKSTPISDRGARLDGGGRVIVDVNEAPFALPRLLL